VLYQLGVSLASMGHKIKIHKMTTATGKERGDLEIKDYVVLQKPLEQVGRLHPPRTFILEFTMTHPHWLWKITRASYWTVHKQKTLGWCS
jgi:hypothetical protein